MTDWAGWLRAVAREPAALIGILASEGSAPRGAGTRMVVTATATHGTIGGGQLEYRAIEQARAILGRPAGSWRVQDYPLGPLLGQCCGGRVRLLIEHVDPHRCCWLDGIADGAILHMRLTSTHVERRIAPDAAATPLPARGERPGVGATFSERLGGPRRPLFLFGAGHVGRAIAARAEGLPLRLAWFDTRPDYATLPGVASIDEAHVERCVADAPPEAAMLILTHDHGIDYRLTRAALAAGPFALVGLIGSATKRARFLARLAADGIPAAALARLTCPIGLPGITGKAPEVIAIAALAQILTLDRP